MPATERPLRVLQVVAGLYRGGIETWLLDVLRNLPPERLQIDVMVQTAREQALEAAVRETGTRILRCPYPARPWHYASRFRGLVDRHGPYGIVHSHTYLFSGWTLCLASRMGIPCRIAHIHPHIDTQAGKPFRGLFRAAMTRLIARHAHAIFAPSQASLQRFTAAGRFDNLVQQIVYNGIDVSRFRKPRDFDALAVRRQYRLPADRALVVTVGRFWPHKNHQLVFEIAQRARQLGLRAHFLLAGASGQTAPLIHRQATGRDEVSVLTDLPDVAPLLQAADVFLFPSLNEGFGIAALEAAAAGLPVVASDLPTIAEALAPGHRAQMFSPGDAAHAARNLVAILNNPVLRESLAAEGEQWARRFTIESSIEQLIAGYQAALVRAKEPAAAAHAIR